MAKIINKNAEFLHEIKKSKFYAYSFYVENLQQIQQYLKETNLEHINASHLVYAYKIGSNLQKYFDAKEPKGSAGLPIFSLINQQNLDKILIIVVRYFGGSKLGLGPLSKAYKDATKNVLEISCINEKISSFSYTILVKNEDIKRLDSWLNANFCRFKTKKINDFCNAIIECQENIEKPYFALNWTKLN
ncbi:Proline dipeptidase [Mesomycoplasma conjunctivae]|uniref:Proline dipeptidase n=1 Tax=Mesomycoplasma conjunctivae (strain ATCC 25834 / NCTC 10147 / HRC/581) TaxID=572263 RepID=C5J6C3_MESCH|nr:YigZ family protein [Mesomycoplasma conjunctivae]CAT05015.1 Proline dipeptidase [Mesomycoplasma conjunctivae]VEU66326.1 Proline dipeptidase [Mesomycoplasma conjunctivae]